MDIATGPTPETEGPTVEDIDAVDVRLDDVERTLTRIDAGSYGRCEACGTLIDDAELATDPTAVRCGSCLAVDEAGESEMAVVPPTVG